MAMPWGAIATAGANLLGGLFGSKKEDQKAPGVDYKALVRDAEAAGFNPLTALRAGGSAAYTQPQHAALSSFNPFGHAMQAVGTVAMNYDAEKERRDGLEYEIQEARLANIQADTKQRLRSMEVPVRSGAQAVDASGRPIRSAASQYGVKVSQTNPLANQGVVISPEFADAQEWGDRWGEPGEWIGGLIVGAADASHHLKTTKPFGTAGGTNAWLGNRVKSYWDDPVSGMADFNSAVENEVRSFMRGDGLKERFYDPQGNFKFF